MAHDREPRRTAVTHRYSLAGRRLTLPLSIALHAVVLYGATRIEWSAPVSAPAARAVQVVWLESPRIEPQVDEALRAFEPLPPEPLLPEPIEQPPAEQPTEPDDEAVEQPEPELVESAPDRPLDDDDVEIPAEPQRARPLVDWEAERRRAVAHAVEEQGNRTYRSFSTEDLPERRPAGDATPPTPLAEVMEDGCVIVTNRFQRMAMMMLGRCVREARGDLFADAMPSYLTKLPVCVDTREEGAAVVDSASGREYSTVKCRLVAQGEE